MDWRWHCWAGHNRTLVQDELLSRPWYPLGSVCIIVKDTYYLLTKRNQSENEAIGKLATAIVVDKGFSYGRFRKTHKAQKSSFSHYMRRDTCHNSLLVIFHGLKNLIGGGRRKHDKRHARRVARRLANRSRVRRHQNRNKSESLRKFQGGKGEAFTNRNRSKLEVPLESPPKNIREGQHMFLP